MITSTMKAAYTTAVSFRMREIAVNYFLLTKPRIVLLVMVTGLTAMVVEGSLLGDPLRFLGVLAGICLAAGAANALNQFWDRDVDAVMERTKRKRPLPTGRIKPRNALWFGLISGTVAVWILQVKGNMLAAMLGLATIVFYVCIYTMWLKRRTSLNIVIGGVSGAAPPLIGWAAGANELGVVPLLMFLVVFLWTPPHFWALALYTKNEYALAGIPMLPVVAGERITRIQIMVYIALLLPVTVFLGIRAELGWLFFIGTTLSGIRFFYKAIMLWQEKDSQSSQDLFSYSIIYLAAVFLFMLAEKW